ncbi:MAG: EAL domain-containing protein [Pseudomonadota bacterium]|nr:EAL domain-containing protein [Pseudomonadota bacterium]
MAHVFSEPSSRLFIVRTVFPIVVLAALVLGGAGWAVLWVGARTDAVSAERQGRLVDVVVGQFKSSLAHDQESVTVWDDAVERVKAGDAEWINSNLGEWMHTYFGHDAAYVLDPADRVVFAFADKSPRDPTAFDAIRPVAQPLAAELRERLRAGDNNGVTERALTIGVSDVALVMRRPAIVSVKPIVSDSGDIEQVAGEEYLHIAVQYLDGGFDEQLGQDYFLNGMHFAWTRPTASGTASTAIVSRDGTTIGYLVWTPYKPGSEVLSAVAPVLISVAAIVMSALAMLLAALRRRSVILRKSEAEVRHLATHDQLTELPNRRQFELRLDTALKSVAKTGESLAVLYLDLDHFKEVNDSYGHAAGDELLREFAERLRRFCRPADTIGRLGGDEFGMILRYLRSDTELNDLCAQLIEMARHPFDIGGTQAFIGVSIGASKAPHHGTNRIELTRNADTAMYHAKRAGRRAFAVYDEAMNSATTERREIERDLRKALESGDQIALYFQPLYSAKTSRIVGVEALLRWTHPQHGRIAPDIFIPIAEESGLIEQLGAWALTEAVKAAKDWPLDTIAVNASASELANPAYAMRVTKALMANGFDPRRLELEVTETVFGSSSGACEQNIAALRELGVRFALDDFGVGFSSLGRLHQFEVDRIKIDRSFVGGFGNANGDEAIVQAIVNLAKSAGLQTTAEGVETSSQSDYLTEIGCDSLQGFLLSRPVPAREITELLRKDGVSVVARNTTDNRDASRTA